MYEKVLSKIMEKIKSFKLINSLVKYILIGLLLCFILAVILLVVLVICQQMSSDNLNSEPNHDIDNDDIDHSNILFVRPHLFSTTTLSGPNLKRQFRTTSKPDLKRVGVAGIEPKDKIKPKTTIHPKQGFHEYCKNICEKNPSKGGGYCNCDKPPFNAQAYIYQRRIK